MGNPHPPGEPTGILHRNCHGNLHGQMVSESFLSNMWNLGVPKKHEGLAIQAVYVCPCSNKMIAV
ncbi:MAG TPA: hypothetical protein VH500_05000 [Nitrososphaeraceae archaeon]|jgi:hypothetical protein